jgi:penicillin-binding protein 2
LEIESLRFLPAGRQVNENFKFKIENYNYYMDFFEISNLPTKKSEKMATIKDYSTNQGIGGFFNIFSNAKKSLGLLIDKKKFLFLVFFIFLILALMILRLFHLQINKGEYYRVVADGNRIRVERIQAKRGIIYDTNLIPLLKNSPSFSLQVIPVDLPKDEDEFFKLENLLNEKLKEEINFKEYISDNILENFQPRIIKESLDYEQAMDLLVLSKDLKGISIVIDRKREYIYGGYFSHVLGYMGSISREKYQNLREKNYYLDDKIGQTGLEFVYEDILRGEIGKKKIEVDSLGKEIKELAREEAIDGQGLVLSLDAELQVEISNLLVKLLEKLNLNKASIVAVNPRDGSILALVSTPTFDNNIFSERLSSEKYNSLINNPDMPIFFRAVSGEYPPGSTFKIVMAAAGLESGIITPNTTFLSQGGIRIGQWFFPDWKAGGHGQTNIKKALAESVNTFFYTIGGGYKEFSGLGLDQINFYAQQFGLGQVSGIDLLNEADVFLPTEAWKNEVQDEPWYIGDTYHLSIGQGYVLVSPLQVAMFTSAIANGGTLYRPQLLKAIVEGKEAKLVNHYINNQDFISEKNITTVQEGLEMSVTDGSCRYLLTLPVSSAGKTGTAQYGNEGKTHAWFTGYAPAENSEIVLTILIEGGGEGSSVAVPLARDILLWYFNNKEGNE